MNVFKLLPGRARHSVRVASCERPPLEDGAQGTDAPYRVPAGLCRALAGLLLAAAIILMPRPAGAALTLYTADGTHNKILKMGTNGVVTVFATNGVNGVLSGPSGMVLDNLGNLYVANNTGSNVILKVDPQGNVSTFGIAAGGNSPIGLALDVSNNLYLAQNVSRNVLKFTNPQAQSGVFANPLPSSGAAFGLAFDSAGNLFVGDFTHGNIFKLDQQGNPTLFVTVPGAPANPTGLAFDGSGNLYVARYIAGDILRYDTNANQTTFATGFSSPYGLAFDSYGNLYVGCVGGGSTIQKVNPAGTVKTTFADAASGLTGVGFIAIEETRFQDNWNKVAGGGSTSTNGEFVINGTTGQQDAGSAMTGGRYGMVGGFWARVSVVPTPGAPALTISITTTNTAMVSWPSPSTGWTLQQNADLTTANWVASPAPVDNGLIKYIIVNPPTGNLFFRLTQP